MLARSPLAALLSVCLSTAPAFAEDPPKLDDAPPSLPAEPPPTLSDPSVPLPALPDLPTLLEAPSIKASRPDGKKVVGLAWSVYSADTKDLNELEQILRSLVEEKAHVEQLPPALFPCDPDNIKCIVELAGSRDVDVILFGNINKVENGYNASIRAVMPEGSRVIAQTDQNLDSKDPAHVRAWAEAIACRLKLQTRCTGSFQVSADLREFRLFLDNSEQDRPYDAKGAAKAYSAPVGVHDARVMFGQNTSLEHKIPIATNTEAPMLLYARRLDKGGLVLQTESEFPKELDGSVVVKPSVAPRPGGEVRASRLAGYGLLGAAVIAGGFGAYEASHGKSLQSSANDSYKAHGAYSQSDVGNLNSGATAIHTGNALMIAGAALLVAGGLLTFAF